MTAQEAIKLLHPDTTKEAIAEIKYYCGFHGKEATIKAIEEACLLACDALEKQVPKKPKSAYDFRAKDNVCENCETEKACRILFPWEKHCPDCGQAIDWTKEEG